MKRIMLIICVNVFCAMIFSMDKEEELRNIWRHLKSIQGHPCAESVGGPHDFNAEWERNKIYDEIRAIKASLPAGRGDQIIKELIDNWNPSIKN